MTRLKSRTLLMAGICCLWGMALTGCSIADYFNPTFLDTFQPLGINSLNTIEGKGPVNVVVENVTTEAKHQESALITVIYMDAQGKTLSLTSQPLNAVPEAKRNPLNANFDDSFRDTLVFDCGIQQILFTGTVYRTKIVENKQTIDLGNNKSQDINYITASVIRVPADLFKPATQMITSVQDTFTAVQVPSVPLLLTKHFQCGDVILVGLLDQRTRNQMIDLQTYEAAYTDLNSLAVNLVPDPNDPNAIPNPSLFPSGPNPQFIFNPSHSYIQAEYQYPVGYVIIPTAMPNMTGIDQVFTTLISIAATNATR
jgi:hypothetical protein